MTDFRSAIENSFDELGVGYDKDILERCVELCLEHGVEDAEEFVDSWMAYSVSHLQGDNPTPQHLNKFEREFLAGKNKKLSSQTRESTLSIADVDASKIIRAYNQNSQGIPVTPARKIGLSGDSPRSSFSPASFSPSIATPSSKYTGRRNAGSVICECKYDGNVGPVLADPVTVSLAQNGVPATPKYMAFQLSDCADSVEKQFSRLSQRLSRHASDDFVSVRSKHSTKLPTIGRVMCDADGKLNAESTLLEGSPDSGGETVLFDLSTLQSYSIFPGQVVAVEGINVSGEKLVAQQLWTDASLPDPPASVNITGSLKVMIASGPFTQTDSLTFEPLMDLINIVATEQPHLLLLLGPLIDSDHPLIKENLIAETFQDLFLRLLDQIMKPLVGLSTEVVLLASHRDCNGAAVFPTPPIIPPRTHSKLHFFPDPSFIDVNGVSIAATTVDVLMHLGKEELVCPPHSGDRLQRLASHILQQQSIYPLRPPPIGIPLDPTFEECLNLSSAPHLLILPSDLRCFIKVINGCTVVNPEHLAKGLVGGSYAKLVIEPNGAVHGQVLKI